MMENFCRLIRQIRDSASEVSLQSKELSAAAVAHMVGRIGAISESTETVNRQSQESLQRADEGNRVLE